MVPYPYDQDTTADRTAGFHTGLWPLYECVPDERGLITFITTPRTFLRI